MLSLPVAIMLERELNEAWLGFLRLHGADREPTPTFYIVPLSMKQEAEFLLASEPGYLLEAEAAYDRAMKHRGRERIRSRHVARAERRVQHEADRWRKEWEASR